MPQITAEINGIGRLQDKRRPEVMREKPEKRAFQLLMKAAHGGDVTWTTILLRASGEIVTRGYARMAGSRRGSRPLPTESILAYPLGDHSARWPSRMTNLVPFCQLNSLPLR